MAAASWLILHEGDTYRIGQLGHGEAAWQTLPFEPSDSSDAMAEKIVAVLAELGYAGGPVSLGIDSQQCLCATLPVSAPQQARQREAMLYELEEWLPLCAEEMVADFVVTGQAAFCVAVEAAVIGPFLNGLESRGVVIQTIGPAELLALQQMPAAGLPDRHVALWQHGQRVSLFRVERGRPLQWLVLPNEPSAVLQQLRILSLDHCGRLPVVDYGIDAEIAGALRTTADLALHDVEPSRLVDAAAAAASEVLAGARAPWIELRRDQLCSEDPYWFVRGSIRLAVAAGLLFLIASTAALMIRSYRYDKIAQDAIARQRAVFEQVFPGQRVPVGIRSRLESQLAQVAGVRGESADLPRQVSALHLLRGILASLPEELRFRVHEVRIDGQRFDLEAEVRSHGNAETLTDALRKQGFRVAPPPTHRLPDKGVSVRITGELPEEPAAEGRKP